MLLTLALCHEKKQDVRGELLEAAARKQLSLGQLPQLVQHK